MHGTASLLSIDVSLADALPERRRATAERDLRVRLRALRDEEGLSGDDTPDGLGLLIASGFLLRILRLGHRAGAEILGPGDVLRPWQDDGEHSVYPFAFRWQVLEPVTLAVLDRSLASRLGPYPALTAMLVGRVMDRSRRAAGQLTLSQLASVGHRILITLWHLADEWGEVRSDGVSVPIPLTHEQVGLLIGARRPAVTTALGRLVDEGYLRSDGDGFVLSGDGPVDLPLRRGGGRGRALARRRASS